MAVDQVTKYTYSMDASAAETLLAIRYTAASRSRKREIEQICPPSSVPFEDGMRKSKRRRTTNTGDIASRVRFKKKKKIRVTCLCLIWMA